MTAYLIARVNVTDMEQYKEYMKLSPGIIKKYGGKFVARGGGLITLEGEAETNRVVIVEFPSSEVAQEMYASEEYQAAIKVRENAADGQFIIVDGVD
ncbi:MAG: hypothetical protein ACI85U_003483 [Candidatus Promineifilaceae bacterium]|jgi:uncharacterized protein (DUF1330 family)